MLREILKNFAKALCSFREKLEKAWQKLKIKFIHFLETYKAILKIVIDNSVKICRKIETFK